MGTMKDRKGMDQTEAEDIKERWQEYTEELYKKDLHDPDHHNGVIPNLEPDILECKVTWASGNITVNKASGGDGIPDELFQFSFFLLLFAFIFCGIYSRAVIVCFFGFFWDIFFFCATSSSGLGTICSFSVRIISVWQGELM